MKRINKGSDIAIRITVNSLAITPSTHAIIKLKFYTLNPNNFIEKTKIDITDDGLLYLQWRELKYLEEGVLYYSYDFADPDATMVDGYRNTTGENTTDYYVATGIFLADAPQTAVKWGELQGNMIDQADLRDRLYNLDDKIEDAYQNGINRWGTFIGDMSQQKDLNERLAGIDEHIVTDYENLQKKYNDLKDTCITSEPYNGGKLPF